MPQSTPMKRQFTTIDGRTVMSNLPQHWKGDDWAITGVDNPLPVGNYVQTEAGVWIPQKGSDDGAANVRLTGSITEQVVFERQILSQGDYFTSFVRPDNAKGVIIYFQVRGVTGTFGNDEGYRFRIRNHGMDPYPVWSNQYTNWITMHDRTHVYQMYPGISENSELDLYTRTESISVNLLPLKRFRINIEVKGTFDEGEGVDCEVRVEWVF